MNPEIQQGYTEGELRKVCRTRNSVSVPRLKSTHGGSAGVAEQAVAREGGGTQRSRNRSQDAAA